MQHVLLDIQHVLRSGLHVLYVLRIHVGRTPRIDDGADPADVASEGGT